MPIAKQNDKETVKMIEEEFRDESELQSYLERSPYLLMSDREPQVVTVQREVSLPAAGSLDLLLVDKEGVPIAVEVKLSRNSQSRREVVAQAFDYVSDLTQLTVGELDDLVEGALVNALGGIGSGITFSESAKTMRHKSTSRKS
jgi:RecB family endonuclease NucS